MFCKACQVNKEDIEFPKNRWRCKTCLSQYYKKRRIANGQKYQQGLPFGDISGQRQGLLTVIKFIENKNQTSWWLVKCECGTEKILARYALVPSSRLKSCGCDTSHIHAGNTNKLWTGIGEISGNYWNNLCSGARTRKLEISISLQEIWDLFVKQNRACALSGLILKFQTNNKTHDGTASLDRIDSNKGYTTNNVQWIHKDINRMKMQMDEKRFVEICTLIANKHKDI